MQIKIKYFNEEIPKLEKISKGDWIDLRADSIKSVIRKTCTKVVIPASWEKFEVHAGDVIKVGLGVAMQLPASHEAIIAPRSSTFKHWGLMQTNSIGIIDNSYCGDNDEWLVEFIATKTATIERFDRICQFRIQKNQPTLEFTEVKELGNKDRNGFGSSGKN